MMLWSSIVMVKPFSIYIFIIIILLLFHWKHELKNVFLEENVNLYSFGTDVIEVYDRGFEICFL